MKKIIILIACFIFGLSFVTAQDYCQQSDCSPMCSTGGVCVGVDGNCICDYGSGSVAPGGGACANGNEPCMCGTTGNPAYCEFNDFWETCECESCDDPDFTNWPYCDGITLYEIEVLDLWGGRTCFNVVSHDCSECCTGEPGSGACVCRTCGVEGLRCCQQAPICDSGLYCDTDNGDYCCPIGSFWNGVVCEGTDECYNSPCGSLPYTSGWWSDPFCISSTQACCGPYDMYGDDDYYEMRDITTY